MSIDTGVSYYLDSTSGLWVAPGRSSLVARLAPEPPPPTDPQAVRNAMVRGVDRPGPTNTGVFPDTTLVDVEAFAGQYYRTFSTANEVITGRRIWAQIRIGAAGVVFRNCHIAGPDPRLVPLGSQVGMVNANGVNHRHVIFENCTFDPSVWLGRGAPHLYRPPIYGFHGHDVTMRWCEIKNVPDGFNIVGIGDDGTLAQAQAQIVDIDRCWIHGGLFANDLAAAGLTGPNDFRVHADAFQINTGKNITVRGCMLGGVRDPAGYQVWAFSNQPTNDPTKGRNSGDDFWNSCFMIQQEVGDDINRRVENVNIVDNFMNGGTVGMNIYYDVGKGPSNFFTTMTVARNKFYSRVGKDYRSANRNGGLDTAYGGSGDYILRSPNIQALITGNTIYETGAAITPRIGG